MVLARPVPLHPVDPLGVRFVQRRVVDHQNTPAPLDLFGCFAPERGGVGLQAMRQPGKGIVRGRRRFLRLYPRRFGRAVHLRRGNQNVDVISGWVHAVSFTLYQILLKISGGFEQQRYVMYGYSSMSICAC